MSFSDISLPIKNNINLSNDNLANSTNDTSLVPENERWLLKPPKESKNSNLSSISHWLREVFDSPSSPLFLHRDNLIVLIDSLSSKAPNNQKYALSTSESFPVLNSNQQLSRSINTEELNSFLNKTHISESHSSTNIPAKNLTRNSSNVNLISTSDIQSIARMEEDNLKAQVAALGKRHTGSQGSLYNSVGGFSSILSSYDEHSPNISLSNLNQSLPTSSFNSLRYRTIDLAEQKSKEHYDLPPVSSKTRLHSSLGSNENSTSAVNPKLSGLPTLSRTYQRQFVPPIDSESNSIHKILPNS